MKLKFLAFLLLAGLFIFPTISNVQSSGSVSAVTGGVFDAVTLAPVPDALISIEPFNLTTETDINGQFSLRDVPLSGEYALITIVVEAPNYGRWTMRETAVYPGVERILSEITLTSEEQLVKSGGVPVRTQEDVAAALEVSVLDNEAATLEPQFWSHDIIPSTIKVAITDYVHCSDWLNAGQPVVRIDEMPFDEYVKNVLGNEWISSWHTESLRAGAMAVKMFAWYRLNLGGVRPGGAHVVDNTCDQVYIGNSQQSTTNAAVDDTWNHIMRADGRVVGIHYLNTDDNCVLYFPGVRCMGQWGSKYLADQGNTWEQILHHYYDPVQITIGSSNLPELPQNQDVIRNGDFSSGTSGWLRFGDSSWAVNEGVLAFKANAAEGGIFQNLQYKMDDGSTLELVLQLGNSSSVSKSPLIRIRDTSQTGEITCQFTIPAGTPLQNYVIRGSTGAWSNPRLEITANPADSQPHLLLDNVHVYYRPALALNGTECHSPDTRTEWDLSNTPDGWFSGLDLTNPRIAADGGTLFDIIGANPALYSPTLLNIHADTYRYALIQMGINSTDCARIYFKRSTQTDFIASQYVEFNLVPDDELRLYTVKLSDHSQWQDKITQISLVPGCGAATNGILRINSIALLEDLTDPVLLSPIGVTNEGYGNPSYRWLHSTDVTQYELYVGTSTGTSIIWTTIPATNYCNGETCEIDATQLSEDYRLTNGAYIVYLRGWQDNQPGKWMGAFRFKLDALPPGAVSLSGTTNLDFARPTFNWRLEDSASYATWFRVYAAPYDDLGSPMIDEWFKRDHTCSQSVECLLQSPVDMPNGRYVLYIQTWGAGGAGGWSGARSFIITSAIPETPQQIAIETHMGRPRITWTDSHEVAWYQVYIVKTDNEVMYFQWHQKNDDLCTNEVCTLIPSVDLTNDTYFISILAWGAGGFSQWSNSTGWVLDVPIANTVTPLTLTGVDSGQPTFRWQALEDAGWYQIRVETDDTSTVHLHWYHALELDCFDNLTCEITPEIYLPNGDFHWSVQAWSPGGLGTWMPDQPFTVNAPTFSRPEPLTPNDIVYTPKPTFSWEHLPQATWYEFQITDSLFGETEPIHTGWYNAHSLNCLYEQVCVLTLPDTLLSSGGYVWQIRAYTPTGIGDWSRRMVFTVNY